MAESVLENAVQRKTIKMRDLPHRSGFPSSNHALQKSFISGIVEPAAALVAQEAAAALAVPAAEAAAAEAAAAVAILPAHLVVRLEVDDLVQDEGMGRSVCNLLFSIPLHAARRAMAAVVRLSTYTMKSRPDRPSRPYWTPSYPVTKDATTGKNKGKKGQSRAGMGPPPLLPRPPPCPMGALSLLRCTPPSLCAEIPKQHSWPSSPTDTVPTGLVASSTSGPPRRPSKASSSAVATPGIS